MEAKFGNTLHVSVWFYYNKTNYICYCVQLFCDLVSKYIGLHFYDNCSFVCTFTTDVLAKFFSPLRMDTQKCTYTYGIHVYEVR